MAMQTDLEELLAWNSFIQSPQMDSFEALKLEMLNKQCPDAKRVSRLKDFYNLIRSPAFPADNEELFVEALKLCVSLCDKLESTNVMACRTAMFICRKVAWIYLKLDSVEHLQDYIATSLTVGKQAATNSLKNSSDNPSMSLVQEVHKALFELELVRCLVMAQKGL